MGLLDRVKNLGNEFTKTLNVAQDVSTKVDAIAIGFSDANNQAVDMSMNFSGMNSSAGNQAVSSIIQRSDYANDTNVKENDLINNPRQPLIKPLLQGIHLKVRN